MAKKKPRNYNPNDLINALEKWPNPIYDKRHGYYIHLDDGRARSNQSRVQHIVKYGHDLKARDLESVPEGINQYCFYKKDPLCKNTFNYYIKRKGESKGFIKVSIRIKDNDSQYAWSDILPPLTEVGVSCAMTLTDQA